MISIYKIWVENIYILLPVGFHFTMYDFAVSDTIGQYFLESQWSTKLDKVANKLHLLEQIQLQILLPEHFQKKIQVKTKTD